MTKEQSGCAALQPYNLKVETRMEVFSTAKRGDALWRIGNDDKIIDFKLNVLHITFIILMVFGCD